MATFRNLLGIICLVVFVQLIEYSGYFLRREGWKVESIVFSNRRLSFGKERLAGSTFGFGGSKLSTENWKTQAADRKLILRIAKSQLVVREATGKNDGKEVEAYLGYTGNRKGEPWCASYVSWVYRMAGYVKPKTAWSPALFPLSRQTISPIPADIFGIYSPKLKRIAHCGLVLHTRGNWIYTIEGNTNLEGSREGDGVYRKQRHRRSIKSFANWIDELKKEVSNE